MILVLLTLAIAAVVLNRGKKEAPEDKETPVDSVDTGRPLIERRAAPQVKPVQTEPATDVILAGGPVLLLDTPTANPVLPGRAPTVGHLLTIIQPVAGAYETGQTVKYEARLSGENVVKTNRLVKWEFRLEGGTRGWVDLDSHNAGQIGSVKFRDPGIYQLRVTLKPTPEMAGTWAMVEISIIPQATKEFTIGDHVANDFLHGVIVNIFGDPFLGVWRYQWVDQFEFQHQDLAATIQLYGLAVQDRFASEDEQA